MTELDIEPITQFLIMACNAMVIVPIIVFGFLAIDRKTFGHATILLMFIMILNAFLKELFQVPLAEHLQTEGYAFPSGHMSAAFAFYGWLFLSSKDNLLKFILASIIIGVGFSLVYREYHNLYDIAGSVLFCTILLIAYSGLIKTKTISDKPFITGYIMISISLGILWYFDNYATIANHVWMAFMTLSGFTLSWTIFAQSTKGNPSILSALIGFLCIIGVYYLSLQIKLMINLPYDFQWAIVGALIPMTAKLTSGASLKG